jgi:hypothetical protein
VTPEVVSGRCRNVTVPATLALLAVPMAMHDAITTTMDAVKMVYESPQVAMVDRATNFENNQPSPDRCLVTYHQLRIVER